MSISMDEQETTFLIDGIDSKFVECYSCSIVYVRRLARIAKNLGIEYTIPFEGGIRVRLPIACLSLRNPAKISNETREAARERMRVIRKRSSVMKEG